MLDKYDHRQLAQQLDLFHQQEEAPGMVYWHPRGFQLLEELKSAVRRRVRADGFREVLTPQLVRRSVWEKSGHWENFALGMFRVHGDVEQAIKPVNCPGHMLIVRRMSLSYRDLPLKLSEFGVVHRDEPSGTLHGLFRLRQFTQDDGHIFCNAAQAHDEVVRFCRALGSFYAELGFGSVSLALSTRPAQRIGDDASWDRAEALLERAASEAGLEYDVCPGEGAFYGPKLEFVLLDGAGRHWQCGTIQLDFFLPERFDVHYVDESGQRARPIMLHRAVLGSLERFVGILLEHHRGALPAWLAPDQVLIAPLKTPQADYARELERRLEARGVRCSVDDRNETLARKIAEAQSLKVPLLLVVGPREQSARTVSVRDGSVQEVLELEAAIELVARRCAPPTFEASP